MYAFPELIKKIREEAGLTQSEFAEALSVSTVLIAMVETGQKEVSKKFLLRLAGLLNVHPASITPFLFINKDNTLEKITGIEKALMEWGEKMQLMLIKDKTKKLRKYAKS